MPKIPSNLAREALWLRGNISWKLHSGQDKIEGAFQKVVKKLFVVHCSRRLGKSYWLVYRAIVAALNCKNKYPIIKLASSTAKDLEEYILPAFRTILEDCPEEVWPGWGTGYIKSKKKFVGFANGAEIQLIGFDKNPDGLRGNYCDFVGIDEARDVNRLKYLYSSVVMPTFRGRKGAKFVLTSTSPTSPAHEFYELAELAQKQNAYIKLTIYDNPRETPETIVEAREECLTESDWLREYMAENVVDENLAILPEWKPEFVAKTPRPEHFSHCDRYISMDIGVKHDLTAVLYAYWNPFTRKLVIEDEFDINGPSLTTPRLNDLLVSHQKDLWEDLPVYRKVSDNNNLMLVQDLGSVYGNYFSATSKDDLHAMVGEVRRMLKAGSIVVDPGCKKLIESISAGIWDKHRKVFSRSAKYGHFDHLAALVYLVRNVDTHRQPLLDEPIRDFGRAKRRRKSELGGLVGKMLNLRGFNRSK